MKDIKISVRKLIRKRFLLDSFVLVPHDICYEALVATTQPVLFNGAKLQHSLASILFFIHSFKALPSLNFAI